MATRSFEEDAKEFRLDILELKALKKLRKSLESLD